jgi:enterochelin esterase-like enzyme
MWLAAAMATVACGHRTPLVNGNEVTFVAPGDPSDPPRIVADFNGWEGGDMTAAPDGRTYTLRVTLDPAARIEYLIAYRSRFALDSANPRTVPAPAGPPRSELRMPAYRPPEIFPAATKRGTIDELPFVSRSGDRRRIRVYRPAKADGAMPVLYVHDGEILADALGLPAVLDALIEANRVTPALVVFIDSGDRHDDYEPASAFRDQFIREIVPAVERRYAVTGPRSLLGLSRSTVGALDACVNGALAFESCALVAAAIPRKDFPRVLPAGPLPTTFFVETGTYDVPLVTDARELRREMEALGVTVRYHESPEGHNRTAFAARLPALLEAMLPPSRRSPG